MNEQMTHCDFMLHHLEFALHISKCETAELDLMPKIKYQVRF